MRIFQEHNDSLAKANERLRGRIVELTSTPDSRTMEFWNANLQKEIATLEKESEKRKMDLDLERNSHIRIENPSPIRYLNSTIYLKFDTADQQEQSLHLRNAVQIENNLIGQKRSLLGRAALVIGEEIQKLRDDIEKLKPPPIQHRKAPDARIVKDRSEFDPIFQHFNRIREIELKYHARETNPAELARLETDYSEHYDEVKDAREPYYDFFELTQKLTNMRDVVERYQQNAEIAIADILEGIECREEARVDYLALLLGNQLNGNDFDEHLVEDLKTAVLERIEATRKLKAVEDWLDRQFPVTVQGRHKPHVLTRIITARESIRQRKVA
jgi:hypothetical protein